MMFTVLSALTTEIDNGDKGAHRLKTGIPQVGDAKLISVTDLYKLRTVARGKPKDSKQLQKRKVKNWRMWL